MESAPEPIPGDPFADNDLPSCEGCRRRKLKCSRQKPLCANCEKYETPCVYEPRKTKPGLKTGAVDALSRRLEFIENFLFNPENNEEGVAITRPAIPISSTRLQPSSQDSEADSAPVLRILTSLASEIQTLNSNIFTNIPVTSTRRIDETDTSSSRDDRDDSHQPHKRRKVNGNRHDDNNWITEGNDDRELGTLPSEGMLRAVLDFYFPRFQPWLPLIHEASFRRAIETTDGRLRNEVVLHAMVVACTRHLVPEEHNTTTEQLCRLRKISREHVVQTGMSGLCVENLQALAILAFTDIGNGECAHAWPVIGSLTRSVQYLQLSVECEDVQKRTSFLKSLPALPEPKNWTEEEERRRVFWNIFILDRFCSVTTGWNTSLTAADVSKRLPVCGGKWYNETPAATPYFGIWSHSSASLGKSITFLPIHYASPVKSATSDTTAPDTPGLPHPRSNAEGTLDVSNIGAFAYYIESIESLSRVNTYFLQQNINFADRHEVLNWLTRFKELDLRLVHWKMFLPHQWKDSGTSREIMPGIMDPNMTAANATHNVSMILLHQKIAYPGPELSGIKLPSACSAETCLTAAIENANISSQFLDQSAGDVLVTPQLGFCLFISASVLLMHWRFLRGELTPEFWTMVLNLEDMSRRWAGSRNVEIPSTVFGQFASRLRKLHQKCLNNPNFQFDLLKLGDETDSAESSVDAENAPRQSTSHEGRLSSVLPTTQDAYRAYSHSENIFSDGTVPAGSMPTAAWVSSGSGRDTEDLNDGLTAISDLLLGQGFSNMDRVISFDEMNFDPQGEVQWNNASDTGNHLVDSGT